MKNQRLFKSTTILAVTLLHAGIIALSWQASKPPEPVTVDNLTFVDLGSIDGDDKEAADGAPAPLESNPTPPSPTPPKPQEQELPKPEKQPEKPRPIETPKPKIQAVVRDDKPADIIKQPEKLVPKPVLPEKTVETPKPEPTKFVPPAPSSTTTSGSNSNKTQGNPNAIHRVVNGDGGGGNSPNSSRKENNAGGNPNADGNSLKSNRPNENKPHTSSVQNGGYIQLPHPEYPANANGDEGTVKLSVLVRANGSVESVTVTSSSGSSILDNAAKRAARTARYQPVKVDGQPVPTRFTTSFTFKDS